VLTGNIGVGTLTCIGGTPCDSGFVLAEYQLAGQRSDGTSMILSG
jgi:hypothetical protein